jgi:hypothetical protein
MIKFQASSGELCMKATPQMQRCTLELIFRQNESINLTSGERLRQLKLIVYFLKIFFSTTPNYTMFVV